jgi:signal recognition particle subunit SRP54
MQAMGGMSGLMGMMPGVAKMKSQMASANMDDSVLKRQMAIIDSMTPSERRNPDILKASRKKRIAAGSGTTPEHINRLLKMHRGMADMMKAMGSGKRGPMAGLANALGMGGGMPSQEEMQKMAEKMQGSRLGGGGGLPPTMPNLPPNFPGLPSGLPGLGGPKLPPGFPGLGKKK